MLDLSYQESQHLANMRLAAEANQSMDTKRAAVPPSPCTKLSFARQARSESREVHQHEVRFLPRSSHARFDARFAFNARGRSSLQAKNRFLPSSRDSKCISDIACWQAVLKSLQALV